MATVKGFKVGTDTLLYQDRNLATEFNPGVPYNKGDYVINPDDGRLYVFTSNHAAGVWTGTDVRAVAMAEEVGNAQAAAEAAQSAAETAQEAVEDAAESVSQNMVDISGLKSALNNGDLYYKSLNIFTGFTESGRINGSTGADAVNPAGEEYVRSGYVELDAGETTLYILRDTQPYALTLFWYDQNKQFLSGKNTTVFAANTANLQQSAAIPDGACYFRTYKTVSDTGNLQISYRNASAFLDGGYAIRNEAVYKRIANWNHTNNDAVENMIPLSTFTPVQQTFARENYEIVKESSHSIEMKSNDGSTQDIIISLSDAVSLIGVQKIKIKLYISNAENISNLTFAILGATNSDTVYLKTFSAGFVNGWNEIDCLTSHNSGNLSASTWSTFSRCRIKITGSSAFTVYLSAINLHRIEKAKLIFVDDHGYHGFKERAYPLLKAAGQPVTWAINPGRLGAAVGKQESILTQADIDELAYDAFSEFSFHSWNPSNNPTKTMTPDELRQDFQKCITYLKKNGLCPKHLWRAAFTQNRANNWWVAQDMVEAAACHDAGGGFFTWPFTNPYNVPRYGIHGRSSEQIDAFFEVLKLTHSSLILYTHGCVQNRNPSDSTDSLHCTDAEIQYLCTKIAAGVREGWLEPTTFNRLRTMEEHGMYTLSDA